MNFFAECISPLAEWISSKPVLLRNQRVVIYFYGLWMAMAYTLAIAVALSYLSYTFPRDIDDYSWILFGYMFPFAVFGARLFSWALEDSFDVCKIFRPGFWWHGGLLGVLVGTYVGSTSFGLPMMPLLDGFGMSMPAFEIFNRIGCLSYGCCWGRIAPKGHPHAIKFQSLDSSIHRKKAECRHEELYPVQVYAILLSALQLGIVWTFSRLEFTSSSYGFLFLFGMATSSVVRIICEFFRGDFRGSGFASTKVFAMLQLVVAFFVPLLTTKNDKHIVGDDFQENIFVLAINKNIFSFLLTFGAAFCAYGVHFKTESSV